MANVLTVTLAGKTTSQIVGLAKTQFSAKDNAGFNIGACAYVATGNTLPAFGEYGSITIDSKDVVSERDFAVLVDRDYKTVNRILNAFKLVVDSGHFVDFAAGLIKFNYDKVFKVLPNLETVFKGEDILDIFALSYKRILARVNAYEAEQEEQEQEQENETENEQEQESNENEQEQVEMVTITYEGKSYNVPKTALLALLEQGTVIE